ncbi:CU044_2847 family protein [Grimontia marina]|uniref:Trypsin-co-occurring domain-containing protein n=1 Tax=Grimontia marina TaxID=646534 RepID=A0A128FE30_9GAMM|nr:CU044_2847 family protein [Grimontia marina]CZF85018.1 hypothetical protein GMA8713_03341 [Grimontia marina]
MNKVIEFSDDFKVEVEVNEDEVFEISSGVIVENSIDKISELITRTVSPVYDAYKKIEEKCIVDSTKITVGVKFGASGNVFVAKSSAEANISVEINIRPKNE